MNKPFILCALAALAAFGQSQTPLTITQSAGSATGELRMQERRTNGQNYVGIRAPQSVASSTVWTLPSADGTSGQCLQTDGSGQWGWGGSSLPVVDTTGIAKGSSDATKIVRFEVDGLTTATTRVLTVPDTNMTLAGRDVSNTFSAAQTVAANLSVTNGSSLLMDRATRVTNQQAYWTVAGNSATTGAWSIGTVPNGSASEFRTTHNGSAVITATEGGQVDFAGVVTTGGSLTVTGAATANRFNATSTNPFQVSGTTVIDSSRNASIVGLTINGNITGDLLFSSSNTYVIGNGTNYLNNIHSSAFTTYGQVKPASGVTTADLGASTTPFRKLWTGDISFTGTMTPPSGAAFSGTKTVRASGGASDCTLTFSAGIMTGGTC
jgi:hypothetical protein